MFFYSLRVNQIIIYNVFQKTILVLFKAIYREMHPHLQNRSPPSFAMVGPLRYRRK